MPAPHKHTRVSAADQDDVQDLEGIDEDVCKGSGSEQETRTGASPIRIRSVLRLAAAVSLLGVLGYGGYSALRPGSEKLTQADTSKPLEEKAGWLRPKPAPAPSPAPPPPPSDGRQGGGDADQDTPPADPNTPVDATGTPTSNTLKACKEAAIAASGQELTFPEEQRSPVVLSLEAVQLPVPWLCGFFWTRAYKTIPGPTLRAKPGETLTITVENNLGPGPGYDTCDLKNANVGWFMNPATICALNFTNLHTHGLHVSPSGNSDNIWTMLKPGEKFTYEIKIPPNHMPGLFWYHPHVHHATAAQAGGGAHGALIVDDPVGYLPKAIEDMPEKLMFLSLVNVAKEMRLEHWGLSKDGGEVQTTQYMWKNPVYPEWRFDDVDNFMNEHGDALGLDSAIAPQLVVNGQYRPKLTLEEGKWYRLRFVFASIEQRVEVYPRPPEGESGAFCVFQLLAKDGIYLNEAPREINRVYMASGSRADVAVSCNCASHGENRCRAVLQYEAIWQPMGFGGMAVTMEDTKEALMSIELNPAQRQDDASSIHYFWAKNDVGVAPPLPQFQVRRPCYLSDLRQVSIAGNNRHTIELPQMYPMQVNYDGNGKVWGHEVPEPLDHIPVGSILEWKMSGIRYHPFHLHVNPFQIIEVWGDPYYQVGDWHDTLFSTTSDDATIRVNVDGFTGHMIAHCHLLEHEDNGMMSFFQLEGEEGAHFEDAWKYDAQCYNLDYPGPEIQPVPSVWR